MKKDLSTIDKNTIDLLRGAGASYLGYLARLGIRAPYLFLAGWLYGSAKFGLFTFTVTLAETLAVLATFGFKNSFYKFLDDADGSDHSHSFHQSIAHALALSLGLATFMALALATSGLLITTLNPKSPWGLPLILISPVIIFIVLTDLSLVPIKHRRVVRYDLYARSLIEPFIMTTCVVLYYWAGFREQGLILAYLTALVITAFVSLAYLSRFHQLSLIIRTPLSPNTLRAMARFSFPTALFQLLRFVSVRIDIFIVTTFFTPAVVGFYGMAWQVSTILKKIRQGFDTLLGPVISREIANKNLRSVNDYIATVARWVISIQLPLVLMAIFFGEHLFGLIGKEFTGGAIILSLLLVADVIHSTLGIHEWPLVFLKPVLNPLFTGMTIVTTSGLSLLFIPYFGPTGVALAGIVTALLLNTARLLTNTYYFRLIGLRWDILKPIIASVITAGLFALLERWPIASPHYHIGMAIFLMLTLYVVSLLLMGTPPEDRHLVKSLRRRIVLSRPKPP